MRLARHRYRTVTRLSGELLVANRILAARVGELVTVRSADGRAILGEILALDRDTILVQLYGESAGLDLAATEIELTGAVQKMPVSRAMLGRTLNGAGQPIDGRPCYLAQAWRAVTPRPINPAGRAAPAEFIETGISAVDGLNTLVKGQKLPVFSCAGLPAKELVGRLLHGAGPGFALVFVALGLTFHELSYYLAVLDRTRADCVAFLNRADEPVMERLLAPRLALTAAEYLAFDLGLDVLVVITDLTSYCEALRQISSTREELPGRRGYPGYLYSDLAALYERAGRLQGRPGSVTMIPVLTMPEDDITHPIPDLTGYITEGQLVLSRDLWRRGIDPPIDILPSLSRLMGKGIGAGRTREDHRTIADSLYSSYARGRELRRLAAIVGREGLAARDQSLLDFAAAFEAEFIHQGDERRAVGCTLDLGRGLLERFGVWSHG
ncbi:MAG: V-type ATP synthase subunit B [Thermodesulfobacteriota bacterium]